MRETGYATYYRGELIQSRIYYTHHENYENTPKSKHRRNVIPNYVTPNYTARNCNEF